MRFTTDEVALPSLPFEQSKDQVEYNSSTKLEHCDPQRYLVPIIKLLC